MRRDLELQRMVEVVAGLEASGSGSFNSRALAASGETADDFAGAIDVDGGLI